MEYTNKQKMEALEQIQKYKKFYKHLSSYIIVNLGLILLNLYQIYSHYGNFEFRHLWVLWVIFGWGLGILSHYMNIKGFSIFNYFFGKDWEERKIKEILEKDKQ